MECEHTTQSQRDATIYRFSENRKPLRRKNKTNKNQARVLKSYILFMSPFSLFDIIYIPPSTRADRERGSLAHYLFLSDYFIFVTHLKRANRSPLMCHPLLGRLSRRPTEHEHVITSKLNDLVHIHNTVVSSMAKN